jgi:non-ribosomal peptide synthetase component F
VAAGETALVSYLPTMALGRSRLNQMAVSNLSVNDRALFERFGFGETLPLPFATVHEAFEYQASLLVCPRQSNLYLDQGTNLFPQRDAVAVEHLSERITYDALDVKANRLAHRLRDHGVGPGSVRFPFARAAYTILTFI